MRAILAPVAVITTLLLSGCFPSPTRVPTYPAASSTQALQPLLADNSGWYTLPNGVRFMGRVVNNQPDGRGICQTDYPDFYFARGWVMFAPNTIKSPCEFQNGMRVDARHKKIIEAVQGSYAAAQEEMVDHTERRESAAAARREAQRQHDAAAWSAAFREAGNQALADMAQVQRQMDAQYAAAVNPYYSRANDAIATHQSRPQSADDSNASDSSGSGRLSSGGLTLRQENSEEEEAAPVEKGDYRGRGYGATESAACSAAQNDRRLAGYGKAECYCSSTDFFSRMTSDGHVEPVNTFFCAASDTPVDFEHNRARSGSSGTPCKRGDGCTVSK